VKVRAYILLALLSSGCAVGPNYEKPHIEVSNNWQKQHWQGELTLDEQLPQNTPADWWKQFHDPLLDTIMAQALSNNRDLAVAQANIQRAKALRDVASSGNMPTLDANFGANRSRYSRQSNFNNAGTTRNTFNASLDASWEFDLFGKTKRAVEAADAQLGGTQASAYAVQLSVVADIASNYFEVRGLEQKINTTKRNIALLQELESIIQAQADAGIVTASEIVRARAEHEALASSLPTLEADKTARIYRISVLTGQPPEFYVSAFAISDHNTLLALPSDPVPVGLRSDMLKRRPDVAQAERNLALATANIGITEAERFPSFSITGAIGSGARVFSDWFAANTITHSLAAALGWSMYSGAANARIDVAEAEAKAAMAIYEQSILLALEDAEAALLRYGSAWKTLHYLKQTALSQQQLRDLVQLRYDSGEDSFESLLTAEQSNISAQAAVQTAETNVLIALSTLYKALGGEWDTQTN